MYEVSDRFLQAVAASHEVVSRVEVWRDDVYVQDLAVTGGTVTVDESSKVRRTLSLRSSDIDLDPRTAEDLLSPFGTDLRVYTGVRFTEGDEEVVPVGVFPIQTAGRDGWLADLGLQADDRSRTIADSRLLKPYTPASGTSALDAIASLAQAVIPSVEVYDLTADLRVTRARLGSVTYERERWDAIEAIASGLGCEAFFDVEGRLIVREVPEVLADSSSVWTVASGTDDAVMLDISTSLSADKVYNAVVASSAGEADAPVITAIVYQESGPLRWRPGVQRPRFYASPLIKTIEDAVAAGRAILARSLVYSQGVGLEALPNPALDVGDVVTVVHPDGLTEQRVVSRIDVPLSLDAMGLDTRVGVDAASASDVGELS
jgi:hypothetical protein